MKIYRIHMSESDDGSHGYQYVSAKRDALKIARDWIRQSEDEGTIYDADIREIVVKPTKAGIIHMLNQYANHHDNG